MSRGSSACDLKFQYVLYSYRRPYRFDSRPGRKQNPEASYYFTPFHSGQKPKLSNVSPFQWMDDSMRILGKLIIQGSITSMEQVVQYAGYIAEVAQLGQKKHWPSVVMYDDAYREAQTVEGFGWGTRDLRDKRDLILEPKRTKEAKDEDSASSTSKSSTMTNSRGSCNQRRKTQGKSSDKEASGVGNVELRLCNNFNSGSCTGVQCQYHHWCSQRGSSAHESVNHPN